MEKLHWKLPDLVDERVITGSGITGTIEGWIGVKRARVALANGTTAQPGVTEALQWYCTALQESFNGVSPGVKKLAVALLERTRANRTSRTKTSRSVDSCKRRIQDVITKIDREKASQEMAGPILSVCQDKHTLPSLDAKLVAASVRLEELKSNLEDLERERQFVFKDGADIANFFLGKFNIKFSSKSLLLWASGKKLGKVGRTTAFNLDAEKALVDALLFLDSLGFCMDGREIRELAGRMASGDTRLRFGSEGPTEQWYAAFKARAKTMNRGIVHVLQRSTDCRTLKWFNTRNINWWFDQFGRKIKELGLARDPKPGEQGELVWVDRHRVIISDETCVSGGHVLKGSASKRKVLTLADRVEVTDKGRGHRRVAPLGVATQEHITLVATVTLAGEVGVPVWICSAKRDISPESRKKIEAIAPRCGGSRECDLLPFGGHVIEEVIIGSSEKGGITRDNITDLMIKAFKVMYPDVAPEPGKRVLWLTDWHDSRLSVNFIKQMRAIGVTMMGWLPNTTSKCQLPDVSLFGPFKAVRDRLETTWRNKTCSGKVDRIARIEVASKALVATFTKQRIMAGAQVTGMFPIDRRPLLEHPSVRDADVIDCATKEKFAHATLSEFQMVDVPDTPSPELAPVASPVVTPLKSMDHYHMLSDTPQREEQAESTFTSISQQKPRLGPSLLSDDPDEARKQVLAKVEQVLVTHEWNMDSYTDAEVAEVERLRNADQRKIAELKRNLANYDKRLAAFKTKHAQSVTTLQHMLNKIDTNPHMQQETLSVIYQRVCDFERAPRGANGLCIHDFPVPTPIYSPSQSADMSILNEHVAGCMKKLLTPTAAGAKRKRTSCSSDSNTTNTKRFKIGALISQTWEIEGTSDAMFGAALAHEASKAERLEAAAARRQAKKDRETQSIAELACRVTEAREHMMVLLTSGNKPTAKFCRTYLSLLRKDAEIYNRDDDLVRLKAMQDLKRDELVQAVVAFVGKQQSVS